MVPANGDDLRFTMLETVGEYGREQLSLSGEEQAVRERHAVWFQQLGERAEPELSGPHQLTWLRLLDSDRANLREALSWLHTSERRDSCSDSAPLSGRTGPAGEATRRYEAGWIEHSIRRVVTRPLWRSRTTGSATSRWTLAITRAPVTCLPPRSELRSRFPIR